MEPVVGRQFQFCEFFGGGHNVHASRLAEGWRMPHQLRPAVA